MFALLHSLAMFVIDFFKSPRRLEAENMFLRHQLSIALRRAPPRLRLRGSDRALLVWITRRWPSLLGAAQVVQRWHRAGFTAFWGWKSRKRAGRPKIDRELRDLIRRMSKENPKWGASRIHGELLMLGFEVAQSTVSKYMVRGGPPSQGWKTFFRNHAQAIAAVDLFVVPTLTFKRLFAFLVLSHDRRQLLWFEVTRHPTAEWLAATDHRSLSLGISSRLLGAGQRPCLRTCLQVAGEGDGHPRSTDRAWIAVAKSVCGASDWHRASRVPGRDAGVRRGAPATNSFFLRCVLQ
jgi:Homeodomain-like domain